MPDDGHDARQHSAGDAHQGTDDQLLEEKAPEIVEIDAAGREPTNDDHRGLGTDVTAHGADHGNEGHQCDHLWVDADLGELNAVRLLEVGP